MLLNISKSTEICLGSGRMTGLDFFLYLQFQMSFEILLVKTDIVIASAIKS